MKTHEILAFRECDKCRQALKIVRMNDKHEVALDQASDQRHVCWNLPEDANLVVIDD